jgi:hypothetical protein
MTRPGFEPGPPRWAISVGFEVLTAVAMKNIISCYVKSCNLVDVKECFEGRYFLLLQGRRHIKQLKKNK